MNIMILPFTPKNIYPKDDSSFRLYFYYLFFFNILQSKVPIPKHNKFTYISKRTKFLFFVTKSVALFDIKSSSF